MQTNISTPIKIIFLCFFMAGVTGYTQNYFVTTWNTELGENQTGSTTIKLPIIEGAYDVDKLELYNVLGAKIFSISKTNALDLTSLKQGIYILKVFSGDKKISRKIIKN